MQPFIEKDFRTELVGRVAEGGGGRGRKYSLRPEDLLQALGAWISSVKVQDEYPPTPPYFFEGVRFSMSRVRKDLRNRKCFVTFVDFVTYSNFLPYLKYNKPSEVYFDAFESFPSAVDFAKNKETAKFRSAVSEFY